MNLILVSSAESDYSRILEYYVGVGEYEGDYNLSERFKEELGKVFEFVREFPFSTPVIKGDTIRKAFMRKFPYSIMFEISGDDILIFSICDQRMNPDEVNLRIKKFTS